MNKSLNLNILKAKRKFAIEKSLLDCRTVINKYGFMRAPWWVIRDLDLILCYGLVEFDSNKLLKLDERVISRLERLKQYTPDTEVLTAIVKHQEIEIKEWKKEKNISQDMLLVFEKNLKSIQKNILMLKGLMKSQKLVGQKWIKFEDLSNEKIYLYISKILLKFQVHKIFMDAKISFFENVVQNSKLQDVIDYYFDKSYVIPKSTYLSTISKAFTAMITNFMVSQIGKIDQITKNVQNLENYIRMCKQIDFSNETCRYESPLVQGCSDDLKQFVDKMNQLMECDFETIQDEDPIEELQQTISTQASDDELEDNLS